MTRVWTVGHSTRSALDFLALLREHEIEVLADIRRFPTSRWEQFKQPNLKAHLASGGIEYVHLAQLGGYRTGGYEAFVGTREFEAGIERLLALAATRRVAIMCAEAVFFRCHRRFVAEALVRRGVEVTHIMGPGKVYRHVVRERLEDRPDGT
ncbi:MAG: DUF488 domain-containing protein [Euryarchaeota archaeon]|nr:DUF488 domain-containing protein [Euryarchaeota archaeon]